VVLVTGALDRPKIGPDVWAVIVAVGAKIRPFSEEPVMNVASVLTKRTPAIAEPVANLIFRATYYQKIFSARATPWRIIWCPQLAKGFPSPVG
jgi:hypothetical protein